MCPLKSERIKKPKFVELDISEDLPRVLDIRSNCLKYRNKLKKFHQFYKDKRVIVVGSSKEFVAPIWGTEDIIVCINGSSHNAEKMGVYVPHLTMIVSYLTAQVTRQHRVTFELLDGRKTRDLVFVTGTLDLDQCVENLKQIDFSYKNRSEITAFELAAAVGTVCGAELGMGKMDQRVSTGMVAIALAILGGASEVVLAGFSFTKGHSYMNIATERWHLAADIEFLKLCSDKRLRLSTTSKEISRLCNLSLADRKM